MKRFLIHAIAIIACHAGPAWAAGGGDDANLRPEHRDPAIEAIQAAIGKPDWAQALALARGAIEKNSANADYHNLYAYAIRMGAKPEMELVFKHYNEALRLNPKHRGAHEYLGEAYLMVGNLGKAKEQLKTLDDLCFFSCAEFTMLKKAIADYEARKPR